ncbi:hypothetical protein MRX96_049187 [Rhipicephalus microplus]
MSGIAGTEVTGTFGKSTSSSALSPSSENAELSDRGNALDQGDHLPPEAVQKQPVARTYPSGYEPAMLEPAAGGLRYDW